MAALGFLQAFFCFCRGHLADRLGAALAVLVSAYLDEAGNLLGRRVTRGGTQDQTGNDVFRSRRRVILGRGALRRLNAGSQEAVLESLNHDES